MANTTYYDLYKALKADGAVQGDWNSFHSFVGAQGKKGYENRKKLYDALKADGAVQDKTYEEFNMNLFRGGQASLRAAKQRRQQQAQRNAQPSARNTAAQQPQQVDYLSRPQSQMPQYGKAPKGKISPFVRALYSDDDARRGSVERPYTMPTGKKEDSSFVQNMKQRQQRQRQFMGGAATVDGQLADYEQQRNQPIVDTGIPDANQSIVKTQGQLMDEMNASAQNMVSNSGEYMKNLLDEAFSAKESAGEDVIKDYLGDTSDSWFTKGLAASAGKSNQAFALRGYNEAIDPSSIQKRLGIMVDATLQNIVGDPEFGNKVQAEADRLGVSPEAYAQYALGPQLMEKISDEFEKRQLDKYMPRNTLQRMLNNYVNSNVVMKIATLGTSTKGGRRYAEQAEAMTAEGKNPYYKPGVIGTIGNVAAQVAGMVTDPAFKVGSKAGSAVVSKIFGGGSALASKIANGSLAQKIGYIAGSGAVGGGVTGLTFGIFNNAVNNLSTGEDTSLWGTLQSVGKGAIGEAASFATMGVAGTPVGLLGRSVGTKAAEDVFSREWIKGASAKVGLVTAKTFTEAFGMNLGGYVSGRLEGATGKDGKPITFDAWNGTLKELPMAIGFAFTHMKGQKYKDKNGKPLGFWANAMINFSNFAISDKAKGANMVFSKDEKQEIFDAGGRHGLMPNGENIVSFAERSRKHLKDNEPTSGADVESDVEMMKSYYDRIIADPNVSWDAKAKFTTMVMGIIPASRPLHSYFDFGNDNAGKNNGKYVYSYANDGTLLSKIRYDTSEDRKNIIYKMSVARENQILRNAWALGVGYVSDNREMQAQFLLDIGYKNADRYEQEKMLNSLADKNSDLYHSFLKWCANRDDSPIGRAVSMINSATGMSKDAIIRAFEKDPMKRSDAEQNICVALRRALTSELFPESKPHPEQSAEDGKDVVADNNLGTEQPNGEAVVTELRTLKQAEEEMAQLMNSNDVFSENFNDLQKKGLTHPQIYDWMIQNGLTEDDLLPYAKYMNQVDRVQGMQDATAKAIEENVGAFVQDWTFHGTMDGQEANGENALWVKDKDGRTLLVGSGDVAYDPTTGRAKEGVGDMLVCLDPNTGEMVYVRAEDTTLFDNKPASDLEAFRRQQLQEINSAPYNQVAQEQAAADAAKPQQEGAAEPENKVGQPQQENTHSEAFKKIVDLAKKQKEYWDNPDGVEKVDVDHEINELLKTLSDEEFEEISDVLVNIDEDLEYHTYNEHERREEANWAKDAKIYRESLQQVKEQLAPYSGALKAAVESSNKTAIAKAQKELTDALLASNLGHGDIYVHLAQFKLAKKKDESYREKRALIKPLTDAINAIESALDSALADAGLDGVHVDFKDNGRGWIYADKGSAWSRRLEPLDNNYRNVSQYDGVNHATTLPQITMDNVAKVAGIIKSRIEEGERYNSDKYRDSEDANNSSNSNETEGALTFKDGSAVPVDANGEPDFMNMTPEQGAEVYKTLFPKTYEAEVDNAVKMLGKDLKEVQKATPKSKGVMARAKEQADIEAAITLAEEQLAKAQAIKKALTAEKVAETMAKPEGEKPTEEANQAGSAAAEKFQNAPRLVGNKRTRTLPNNEKVKGHYEIVPAESLTPSHDAMNGYKKSDGFPVDSEGRTINDRDYENDKSAQQNTDQIALKYNGQAIEQVPVVSDEGIVYDGNGRTMAGQKAAKDGTDAEYINDLMDNAENFGFTREQIEQSGIEHPRLVMVTDERMPYTTDTFAKFNRNEKKTQSNTEQAVAKAKTLTADEVGAIVAEIEGNGSLDAFFNNPNAINSLIKTLVSKDIIGQNEVAELMEGNDRLSPQGKEMVKNILLGSIFKPETIRMLGVDSAIKNKAVAAIRSVMDNLKLGDYSLRDEIDSAIQLLYEARRGDNKVDTLLRTPEFFGESAADRYPSISQMMALALEGKVSDFRDLINEYNREAAARNTGEGDMFGDTPTKEELIRDFLEYKKWKDYETRGNSETERSNDAEGVRKTEPEAQGGNGEKQAESRREVDEADYIDGKDETSAPITITTKSGNEHSFDAEQVDLAKKIIAENPENPVPKLQRKLVIGYNVAEELAKALGWQNPEDKISRTEELIRKTLYPTISDFKENPEKARKDLATLFNTLNNEELKVVAKDALISSFQIDKNGTAKDDWHSVAIEEVKSLLKARGVLIKKGSRGLAEGDTAIDKYGYIHKVIAIKGETIVIEYDNGEQEETKKREVKYYFHSQEQAAERNNGNQSGFEQFMEDSPETENIKTSDRSAMQKFSDKALSLQSAETKDYSSYNAQKTTVEIKADNLFKSEKDWFSLKKYGDSIAFHDKKNGCSYELSAYKDARGHLKSVFVTKYHDFKDGADSKPRLQKVDLEDLPKEYRDFSSELGVDALNLFLYGESMKYNDFAYAYRYLRDLKAMYQREHVAEKKAIMERDGVSGLIANKRLFEPIEKAVKEKYGDVDVLIEERRKRAEEERNVMEAARKRVEEEERKRQERLEKLSLISDEDLDKRYMDALAKGDEATAREMLDEVARRKGYGDADSDYQGVGAWSAPSNPGYESDEARRNAVGDDSPDLNIEDMAAGYNNQPNDIFEHPEKYSQGLSTSAESGKAIQAAIDAIKNGYKDVKIKVYRAVPTSVKEGKLRNGDWVTPSRRYAEMHGNNRLDGKYRIIEDEVPAKELWWDSNDVNEWGYDNGKSYKYKNAKNNRKSNDLVTRDDKGEVIPPSKRFNSRKADERYQKAEDAKNASKREQALRDAVVDTLRDAGIEVSMDAEEGQRVLDESNGKARMQAKMSALIKAANSIRNWLTGNKRNKVFTIELPQATQRMVRNVMGRDFDSHNITANGIAHAKKNHGVNGTKLTENSIPLRDADFELIPYIMTAPSYVRKGTSDKTDRESIRFYKELGNGYVVVAEKEYKNSPNDMETITMWAELSSSEATNARRNAPDTHVQNAILSTEDAAKIRKDAETAIENDVNLREQRVFHGAGADITDHVRFFRTSNGEAYGYTIGGKIYIDPRIANSETPVHEYAHLWATALRSGNAEEWQNVVGLMKGTSVWDEVKKRYPELKTNDEVADEVLAAYSGRRGAERLREEMDNAKGDAKSALQRVKEAIGRFWKATADMLHIHYKSAEEVADRVMKDLLDGVNPRKMGNASAYPMEALTKAAEEYRNERSKDGVQYSKTDAKDVKNSRIIPEDVDKSVSSQIEKKFDNTINDISSSAGKEYRNNIQSEVDYVTSLYSNMRRVNVEHEKTYYENEIAKLSRGTRRGGADSANGSSQSKQSDSLSDARTNLAAIERELAYRDARAKTIRDTYGLSRGSKITPDVLERIFKEGNPGKEQTELFQKAFNIAKRLGVDITMESGADTTASGEATISRKINLFLDGLVRTRSPKGSMSRVLLHEMLHQSTMGAINLVKSGKAKGMLTDKQIEAVNTILDLYDKVKNDKERFKEEPYGLQNEYEFAAQMADPRQRKALDLDVWDRIKNAAHELANKGDRSMWQTFKDAVKKLFEVSDKDVMDKALNDIMDDFNETVDDISMNDIEQDGFAYKVTDKDELDRLNKEKTFRMYSGMQELDGKLYSPMAAIIDGKRTDATEIGAWMRSDERPDLVKGGKFTLVKTDKSKGAGEGDVDAAYNPYMHTSTSMMNDQFTGAYARGNIKVVEWDIPESEKTSGYHAEGAKNSVGLVPWHSGSVNGLLPKDRQRSVMLSRWRKAVRVVPDSEVAESIANQLKGTGLAIPWNVVTPNQLRELAKLGVPITTKESGTQSPDVKAKFNAQMEDLKKEFPQAKFVDVKMTKDAHKEWGKNGGTHFREDRSSEDLYNSLNDKQNNKKEYNGTVTELANRVKQGTARIVREGEGTESSGSVNRRESLPAIAGKILNAANKQGDGQSTGLAGEASDKQGEKVLHLAQVYGQIEQWAKENGCYFTEDDIAKDSLDGKVWNDEGVEATIYRSKDGKSVIKVMSIDNYYNNAIDYYLDRNNHFNEVFPDTAIEVVGYGRDSEGRPSIIYKQPLVEGKTVYDYFNGDDIKANEYIDNMLAEMGYDKKVAHDDFGLEADSNGKYNLFDVNYRNVIIDKDGKPHVIDAEVLPVDYKKDGKVEIKNGDGSNTTRFRMELGKTFSNSKEDFDGVRSRAVEENGIVMPNLNKESVNVVPVENHNFGNNIKESIENANKWAKENLVTSGNDLPTMRDGTPYTISKAAIDKYLSKSATSKSEDLNTHLSVLQKLTDVIHESIEAEIHPDYKKGDDGVRNARNGYGDNILIHRLYGAVELDGKMYRVKTTMQEFRGGEENKPHSYEVTKIELLEGSEKANESDSLPLSSASNNSIEAAKLLNGVEKSYDSGKKLLDESKDLTEGDTYFKDINTNSSIADDAPLVVKHVDKIAKQVGGKVKMAASPEEVTNKEARERIERGENVTGWYDEKTGEVHLYMPNIHDRYTAEKTIWHEVVGHKGMRELIGEENYSIFLRSLWYDLDRPENARLKELVSEELKYNPLDFENGIEEGIARLVEDGKGEPGFWNNIKNKVTDMLHEIGYRVAPNTKDVKYLLWLAKNMQKRPNDLTWKMRADAVRYKLSKENVPAIIDKDGYIVNNDGKEYNTPFDLGRRNFEEATDGRIHFRTTLSTASKIDRYNRILGTKMYAFKESTVDDMQSVQEFMEIVSGKKNVWESIPSSMNPLQAHNRVGEMIRQRAEKYEREFIAPLDEVFKKAVSLMDGKDGLDQKKNFELYAIQKHGLERNRVLFVRDYIAGLEKDDADILSKQWDAEKKDLDDRLRDGTINLKDYYEEMDEWIRNNVDETFVADEHDYSGFHAIQNIGKQSSPYNDKMAIDNVMNAEDKMGADLVKDFWEKKKAATDWIVDNEYTFGMADNSQREHLKNMFNWYLPLRKFDETTAEDVYGYINNGGDPSNYIGSVIANAKGRTSLSDTNVLAQISAMANASLVNGGNNYVKQHLARFVSNYETGRHKDRIFLEINPWVEKHTVDGKEVWEEVTPQIPENATQEQISDILRDFEDDMKAKESKGEAKLYNRRRQAGYRFVRTKDKSQHLVEVYIAGKRRLFFCQANPRAAQAINGLLKDSGTQNRVAEMSSKINRLCAQLNTSYNPDFIESNMMRDLTAASANVVTKEGIGYAKDFMKEYRNNFLSFWHGTGDGNYWTMFKKYRNGTLNMGNDKERLFKEFIENGGQTGFVQMQKLDELVKSYDNFIKTGNKDVSGWLMRQIKDKGGFIEAANEVIENMARFSTYTVSRNRGRSVGLSIYNAKEVSVNFNRHGSGDAIKTLKTANDSAFDTKFRSSLGWFNSVMKNHTMFYNAGVQGANLFFKNYKAAWLPAATAFGALPFGLNIAMALINQYLINQEDEKERNGAKDPYAEQPEWKRRNNLCLYVGKGRFATVPMAIELRAFYGLGDIAMSLWNPRLKSATPFGYDVLGQMAQLVPASDFLGHHSSSDSVKSVLKDMGLAVTPTILKPEMELIANRDWTGRPIYRDDDYLDNAPQWKSSHDSTNDVYMAINKRANMMTNGLDNSNPDLKGNDALDYGTAPYTWQHLIDGYFGGLGATIVRASKSAFALGKSIKEGVTSKDGFSKGFSNEWSKFDKNQIPFWRVFVYKPSEGHDMQRTKSKWYNYKDELEKIDYNIKQLKVNTPDSVQNIKNAAKLNNFYDTNEGKQILIYQAANKDISRLKGFLKKTSEPDSIKSINENIDRKMQEAVDDLDKLN